MVHELKIRKPYFDAVASGEKTFEVRLNDRGYQKGDTLILMPWSDNHHCFIEPYTGLRRLVTYVHSGRGCAEGWVILGIKVSTEEEHADG